MEGQSTMETPSSDKSIWSPDILHSNHPHSSTPYLPLSLKKLDDSEGSSKQDSGYCSATPRSAGLLFEKCHLCNKSLHHSYALSTPEYLCSCKRSYTNGSSPNVECMEAIEEVSMSPMPKLSSRLRLNRPLGLGIYEDAMDTSLYHEEMDVDSFSSKDNHQYSLDFMELGEEKSVDFIEPNVFSASQSLIKETPPLTSPSKLSSDNVKIGATTSQNAKKQDKIYLNVNSEEFFSPELFDCDQFSSKTTNEVTPTKSRIVTTPKKQKKVCSFQSSAKKVATMNKVVRSFYTMNGIETVDFLYQLGVKRSYPLVVSKILKYLTEKDLDTVRVVSKTWNRVLNNDNAAWSRWKIYSNTMQFMKENSASPVKQSGRNRPVLTRLQNVANHSSPPRQMFSPQQQPYSPPVSPGSTRFHSYRKAAKSLKKNERLLPCPKCRFPSTDRGNPVAQCPRSGCRHRFCVWCSIEILPDLEHNCPPLYTPRCLMRRNTVHSVGSKSSKRNLRRL